MPHLNLYLLPGTIGRPETHSDEGVYLYYTKVIQGFYLEGRNIYYLPIIDRTCLIHAVILVDQQTEKQSEEESDNVSEKESKKDKK